MTEITKEVIKAYALENAIKYNGKANQGAVLASLFAEGLEKSKIKDYLPKIQEVLEEVNSLTPEKQKQSLQNTGHETSKREIREGLPELPNAEKGKVMTRFAPFPSGPLHIGNARTLVLNDEYAKMYDGKMILVIDDTIGSKQKPINKDAYKLIKEGAEWLETNFEKRIVKKSDRIQIYYDYAEEMIKKGYMYICNCPRDEMKKLKDKKIECSCRQFTSLEQLDRWKKMFSAPEGSMCVRLKTSMSDPDPAFRDRIMFRISDRPHATLGTKYRVYPLLDFSWAIDDHLLGITHILRGMELTMETRTEKFIWDIFKWPHAEVIYNGHFGIEGVKVSKSKSAAEVKSGEYTGWNDPRTWSIQSLRDRGFQPKAIHEFIINAGVKKTNVTIPIDVLYALNRKVLGDIKRYFFVENPIKIKIAGCPHKTASIPFHPTGKLGKREFKTTQEFLIPKQDFDLMQNKEYRLMHLLNFKSDNILMMKPRKFSYTQTEPKNEKGIKFIHWLPLDNKNIEILIRMPNGDILKGLGEPELRNLNQNEIVYFERFGFVKLHAKLKERLEFWFAHS